MVTRARAEVGGRRFESPRLQLLLPNKHLYSRLEEPGLKIKTFSPDCIVPVPKPGLKGVEGLQLGSLLVFVCFQNSLK